MVDVISLIFVASVNVYGKVGWERVENRKNNFTSFFNLRVLPCFKQIKTFSPNTFLIT